MFLFKKIVTPFLLPPGIFVAALFASGCWFLFKKDLRKAGIINLLIGVALWGLSIVPVSDALVGGLSNGLVLPTDPHGDVIILLGGGIYSDVQDATGSGVPSNEMLSRIVAAVRLQKKLHVPIIVSTGVVFPWEKSEALVDKRFLIDLGVLPDKIILEESSRDTIENARFTNIICEQRGFREPLLVTSSTHMKRALLSFSKMHRSVSPYPVNLRTGRSRDYVFMDYLPGDPETAWIALREYLGLLFYRLAY